MVLFAAVLLSILVSAGIALWCLRVHFRVMDYSYNRRFVLWSICSI